jgi:hypothetical protein
MQGQAGELLRVLDKVLISGYTGKAAAGWSKPVANSSNSGAYKQGAGAGMALHIQDNGGNVTSTFKEAWATGWEVLTAVNSTVGTGSGQFPTAAQLLSTGHTVIRKSNTADTTGRQWLVFADASTFYLFILSGDVANTYTFFMFGDVFALHGSTDSWRCMIIGRTTENSTSAAVDLFDSWSLVNAALGGHFMARTWGGGGASITVGKQGDAGKTNSNSGGGMIGLLQTPNASDNTYYLSPLWVFENSSSGLRGRLRGCYQNLHGIAGFSDGQTFAGANDFAGKTFQMIKATPNGASICMEISNSVETN